MKDTYPDNFLQQKIFLDFGADIFNNRTRLPVLGAILELAPVADSDMFYAEEVHSLLNSERQQVYHQIQWTVRSHMVARQPSLEGGGKIIWYQRLVSPRWDVAESILRAAEVELEIDCSRSLPTLPA